MCSILSEYFNITTTNNTSNIISFLTLNDMYSIKIISYNKININAFIECDIFPECISLNVYDKLLS